MSWCGGGEISPTPGRRQPHAGDVAVDLVTGQLAALAGLRALRHLDLQLVGVREVVDVDAEPARGDLLDRRAARVAVRVRDVARRILAALAGVRAAADPVHRDRERLVRLARERAERHRAGGEALHDLRRGLDLLERDPAVLGVAEREQAAQRAAAGVLRVDRARVLLVGLPAAVADRVLEQRDRLGVPLVMLPVAPPRVDADHGQQLVGRAGVRALVAGERLRGERLDPDPADARRGSGEVPVDELGGEPDGLEDLRAAVRAHRRDAHLGHRLEEALGDPLHGPVLGLVPGHLLRQPALVDEVGRASRASGRG